MNRCTYNNAVTSLCHSTEITMPPASTKRLFILKQVLFKQEEQLTVTKNFSKHMSSQYKVKIVFWHLRKYMEKLIQTQQISDWG